MRVTAWHRVWRIQREAEGLKNAVNTLGFSTAQAEHSKMSRRIPVASITLSSQQQNPANPHSPVMQVDPKKMAEAASQGMSGVQGCSICSSAGTRTLLS